MLLMSSGSIAGTPGCTTTVCQLQLTHQPMSSTIHAVRRRVLAL